MPNPTWIESARLSRDHLLKLAVAAPLAYAADQLLPAAASAQEIPRGNYSENDFALSRLFPGAAAILLHTHRHWGKAEDIGGFTELDLPSSFPDRPHKLVGIKGGDIIYRRAITFKTPFAVNVKAYFWDPEKTIAAPNYHRYQPANSFETQIRKLKDVVYARVVEKATGQVMETHMLPHKTPLEECGELIAKYNQGEYRTPAVAPEPKAAPPKPTDAPPKPTSPPTPKLPGLIMLNGLSTNGPLTLSLDAKYGQVGHFSYQGGEMKDDAWKAFPYTYEDTWIRSIKDHAALLKVMIDQFGQHYKPLDLVGYSLGGVIAWEYLKEFVLPENGAHRDGFIRKFVALHSPINGVRHSLIPNWMQAFGVENQASNQITQYLSAQASTEEKQKFTAGSNRVDARYLAKNRGIEILTLGNKDDRIADEDSTVIIGFGDAPSLGPEFSGPLSFNEMIRLALLPGGLVQNIGHDRLVTSEEGRKRVEKFLNG